MSEAEKIIKDMPFVKDGLDNFYGYQTVLNALNQALNIDLVSQQRELLIDFYESTCNITVDKEYVENVVDSYIEN